MLLRAAPTLLLVNHLDGVQPRRYPSGIERGGDVANGGSGFIGASGLLGQGGLSYGSGWEEGALITLAASGHGRVIVPVL